MRRVACSLGFLAAFLGTAAAVAGPGTNPAGAAAPDLQGWWTPLNQGRVPEVGQPTPSPTPPDVPAQGLLVEGPAGGPAGAPTAPAAGTTPGAASAPLAYAGLVYFLPPDATASTLTLNVAANSATTPMANLELCPLVNPVLQPEQGGPSSDAPPYDCTHSVSAGPNAAGNAYQFQVAQLVTEGSLAVAVLPTSPTDRVVFSQPDANSLAVGQSSGGSQPGALGPPSGDASTSAIGTSSSAALPIPMLGITDFGATLGPALGGAPAAPPAAGGTPAAPPAPAEAAPRSYSAIPVLGVFNGENANPLTVALVIAGLAGGAALWFLMGRKRPDELELATSD